jgi:hypothetical protein
MANKSLLANYVPFILQSKKPGKPDMLCVQAISPAATLPANLQFFGAEIQAGKIVWMPLTPHAIDANQNMLNNAVWTPDYDLLAADTVFTPGGAAAARVVTNLGRMAPKIRDIGDLIGAVNAKLTLELSPLYPDVSFNMNGSTLETHAATVTPLSAPLSPAKPGQPAAKPGTKRPKRVSREGQRVLVWIQPAPPPA